jgi:NodT family efflux transporter outer membrane factor (OMF) lipoprotein
MTRSDRRLKAPLALVLTAVLAGCSLIPTYERPSAPVPAAWSSPPADPAKAVAVTADWWQHFQSPELDRMMDQALAYNQDIAAAIARIDQARAAVRIAGSTLLPSVEGTGTTSEDWVHSHHSWNAGNSNQVAVTANYELDLWGKNRAGVKSAKASLTSSIYDHDALALVVQSEVATTYFQVVALKERLKIAQDNLAAARQVEHLVEVQLQQGAATALDLAQQSSAVATFEAQLPQFEQQIEAAESALAILLGQAPSSNMVQANQLESIPLPAVAAGQPSDLLERRPDIRKAEADLLAANANIGVARAEFYPSVTLSAAAAVSGIATSGTSAIASLAAGLVAPIFEGGLLEGQLEQAKGQQRELVATYRQTILTSFKEVEDAMTGIVKSAETTDSLTRATQQAAEAFRLAQISYTAGASDFLTVLDAQRTLLTSQDSLVQAELDRYTNAATLFKAVGGGWSGSVDMASLTKSGS